VDVSAFASLFVETAMGASGAARFSVAGPEFVTRILPGERSLVNIVERLKANRFEIIAGVDREDLSAFVTWLELADRSGKWE
jgi:hypothetical protein